MTLVVDASIVLSWCFTDEGTEASRAVLGEVVREGAVVPPHWRFEVANGLQVAVRRRRIESEFRDLSLADLAELSVFVDSECDSQAWRSTVRLADRHGLTIYDAAYLELAQRLRMELATLDAALAKGADAESVTVIGRSR